MGVNRSKWCRRTRVFGQEIKPRLLLVIPNQSVVSINRDGQNQVLIQDDNGNNVGFSSIGYAYFAKLQANRLNLNSDNLDLIKETLNFENFDLVSNSFVGESLLDKNYNL